MNTVTAARRYAAARTGIGGIIIAVITGFARVDPTIATDLPQAEGRAAVGVEGVAIITFFITFILRSEVAAADMIAATRQRAS